jgi:hypothetical protein
MKKIFTLISVALCAMSVNAQTWKAAEYDLSKAATETLTEGIYKGNADGYDVNQPSTLESSSIVVEDVEGIKMTAVSTPNNLGTKDIEEGKKKTFWELKGSTEGADALITSDCTPQFAQYLMPQGNPTFIYWDYEVEGQNGLSFKVGDIPEIYWTPGANMPAKGAFYKFAATKSGDLRVAIYGNKNANPTYIVDESTKQPLAPASVTVSIYYQNTGFAYEGNAEEGTAKYFNVGPQAEDYVLQHTIGITQNRPVLGYIDFSVEAGKTYWLFNPKSQIGIYGFFFQVGGSNGIASVKAELDADAPIYNLAGQKVDKSFKGVVIQNGKKVVIK